MDRQLYTRAALIGGLISGVLSAIPGINAANCCCCGLWMIVGGAIASYIYVSGARTWPSDGEGALVGLGAGAIGGTMGATANVAWQLISSPEASLKLVEPFLSGLPPEFSEAMRQGMEQQLSAPNLIMGMVVSIMFFCAVSTLSGFVFNRIFRDRRLRAQAMPYPPQQWYPPPPGYGPPAGYGQPPAPGYYGYPPPAAPYPPPPPPGQAPSPAAPAPGPPPDSPKPEKPEDGGGESGTGGPPWGGPA